MHDRRDQAQIRCDGRLGGEQSEDALLEIEVQVVDLVVACDHLHRKRLVAVRQRVDGPPDRALGELAQMLDLRLQGLELFVESRPRVLHQPNRPVT